MKRFNACIPLFCAAVIAAGCGKKAEAPASPNPSSDVDEALARPELEFDEEAIYSLFEKVDGILCAGNTNEATRVFVEAIDNPEFAPAKQRLFTTLLRFLLYTDQVEEAKSRYLAALRTEPESALPAQDFIYGHLLNTGDRAAALDWARTLTAQDLPIEARTAAVEWLATGYLADGNRDGALAAVTNAIAEFPPAIAAPMAQRFAQEALSREPKDVTLAEGIVSALSARSEAKEYASAATGLELRILAAKRDFAGAVARIPQLVGRLPDAQFVQGLNEIFRAAEAAGNAEAVDSVSSAVVLDERFAEYPSARLAAARRFLGVVLDGTPDRRKEYPQRFDKLMKLQFRPAHLYSLYARYFYDIMDDIDVLRETAALGKALRAQMEDPSSAEGLKSFELDADFVLGDYDAALDMINGGIADHDAAWHQMTRTKILAHKALDGKDWATAVARFREFLDLLPDEDQHDPTTGIVYSRDSLVGLNEKRIGDIWTGAGEPAKAAEAYAAAREAYKKAIEKNQAGTETADYLQARLDEIPAPAPVASPAPAEAPAPAPAEAPAPAPAPAPAEAPAPAPVASPAPAEAPAPAPAEAPAPAPAEAPAP